MSAIETVLKKPSVEKPWLKFFTEEDIKSDFPRDIIYNVINRNNKDYLDNYAINYYGNRITYKKFLNEIDIAAASLESLGVKKGDVVACSSITIPEMVISLYAANKIGATLLAIDPRRTASFIKEMVDDSKAKVFMFLDLTYQIIKPILPELNVEKIVTVSADNYLPFGLKTLKKIKDKKIDIPYSERIINWKSFLAVGKGKTSSTANYGDNDVVAITFTGGTTGEPKGVMLTNDGFNCIYHCFEHCGVKYTRDQRFLDIIPAFSSYGVVASMHMPLSLGLEIVIIPKFEIEKVGYYVKHFRPNHTLLVPAHYEKLMNSKEMKNGFDLSFFETAGSGGDTMNVGLETKLNNFLKEHGCAYPLSQGYGMSEVSSAACCCCGGNFKSLSVGYPLLKTVISVFKPETTEELGYNEEGEICITGPSVMAGYYHNDEETENIMKMHPDGQIWVHSGDIGYMDEEGFVFIKGRIKRMITRFDGHKIFPTTIESAICKHKDVDSCAVVDVTDVEHAQGRLALAVIQFKPECDKEKALREIDDMIVTDLEERGRPSFIEVIDEMPHTTIGKIDYAKLTEMYSKD